MIYPKTPFCPANNCVDRSNEFKPENDDKPKSDYSYNPEQNNDMKNDNAQNGMMNGNAESRMRYDNTGNTMRNNMKDDATDRGNSNNMGRTQLPQNGEILAEPSNMTQSQLMQAIRELDFVVTDLNLFLDTHPYDEGALEMFTTLAATLKSYKYDYEKRFGPICVCGVKNQIPFEWVADGLKWPWEN